MRTVVFQCVDYSQPTLQLYQSHGSNDLVIGLWIANIHEAMTGAGKEKKFRSLAFQLPTIRFATNPI